MLSQHDAAHLVDLCARGDRDRTVVHVFADRPGARQRTAVCVQQRYPNDYNGIVAGAPAAHFQIQNSVYHGWSVVANSSTGDSSGNAILYPDKIAVLHKAVLAACADTPDGLISDPRACSFDPASIACPAGSLDTSQCLTR